MNRPSRILNILTLVLIPALSFAFGAGIGTELGCHSSTNRTPIHSSRVIRPGTTQRPGTFADLRPFKNTEDRVITPEFIEGLLRNRSFNQKENRKGIHIEGARFNAPFDIDTDFSSSLWLGHCEFLEDADFSGSHFAGTLQLDGSTFKGITAFRNMVIGDDFLAREATFEKPVDFTRTLVDGIFSLDGASFLNTKQDSEIIDFESVIVKGTLTLDHFSSERSIQMPGVQIRDLVIQSRRAPMLDLSGGSVIQNDLDLDLTAEHISIDSLKVAGTGFFRSNQEMTLPKSI